VYRDKPEGRRVPRISYGETGEGPPGISNVISLASLDIRGFHKHTDETLGNHFSTSLVKMYLLVAVILTFIEKLFPREPLATSKRLLCG